MDTSTFKVFAQRLRAHLQQHCTPLQHGQALDLVASIAGLSQGARWLFSPP
ncbi:glyoxalase superfamily protein [Chromobacterium sp. IIBBL 290-4]|uniref:glyoxalase superfamily protein n=1 Tax=Chromobacterium sp. IIBBL 290-4 TaxID=2953890 RepID=UPI00353180AB